MTLTFPSNTALLSIDVQQGFYEEAWWGARNNPHAEQNVARLLYAWRDTNRPVYHSQHLSVLPGSPLRPNQPGADFQPEVAPQDGEPVITKNVNSAFIGTDLEERLRSAHIDTLVLCGLTTPHCVSTTARMAGNLGFTVYVVADATAAHAATGYDGTEYTAQQVHEIALANLHHEFGTVMTTADVLAGARP
jgi:nicotinamidase-related amidase